MRQWCHVLNTYRHGGHQCAKFGDDTDDKHCDGSTNQNTPGTDLKKSRTLLVLGAQKLLTFFLKKNNSFIAIWGQTFVIPKAAMFSAYEVVPLPVPQSPANTHPRPSIPMPLFTYGREKEEEKPAWLNYKQQMTHSEKNQTKFCTTHSMLWWRRDSWRKKRNKRGHFSRKKKKIKKKKKFFYFWCFVSFYSLLWTIDWLIDLYLNGCMDLAYRRFEHTHGSLRSTLKNQKHHIDVYDGTCWIVNKTNFTVHTDSSNYSKHTFMRTVRAK